jgi:hypothetical protein
MTVASQPPQVPRHHRVGGPGQPVLPARQRARPGRHLELPQIPRLTTLCRAAIDHHRRAIRAASEIVRRMRHPPGCLTRPVQPERPGHDPGHRRVEIKGQQMIAFQPGLETPHGPRSLTTTTARSDAAARGGREPAHRQAQLERHALRPSQRHNMLSAVFRCVADLESRNPETTGLSHHIRQIRHIRQHRHRRAVSATCTPAPGNDTKFSAEQRNFGREDHADNEAFICNPGSSAGGWDSW